MHHEQLGDASSSLLTLRDLGWNDEFARALSSLVTDRDVAGRVIAVHRNRIVVAGEFGERSAILTSGLRDGDALERPATGDWVTLRLGAPADDAQVRSVIPRQSVFTRRAAGEKAVPQVVAANIDRVFIVSAMPDDVNARRIERYLAVAWESGALPVVVLTKSDQVEDVDEWLAVARAAAPGVDVIAVSTVTGDGIDALGVHLQRHTTVAFLGSSGVGKSTLLNHLAQQDVMRTGGVRDDGKGRHTTTHRELIRLPSGVLVIDTPGMRELQLWAGTSGLDHAFDDITALSAECRFADCTHGTEPGCAVTDALRAGVLDAARLSSWRKLSRELARAERMSDAVAAAAERAKVKSIHRLARTHQRDKNK